MVINGTFDNDFSSAPKFIISDAAKYVYIPIIFLSRVKINSINWPAPNIWVFIAQLVEHCSANAEAMGSNPVEALKFFSGLNLQLLKLRLQLRWSNVYFICISAVHIIFISYSCHGLR